MGGFRTSVYVLYEGNEWLNTSSLVPMGIFDDIQWVLEAAKDLISERHSDEDEIEEIYNALADNFQTQGYDVNYLIKEVELNKLEEF